MHLTLVNLLGVATIAFCVPFVLGFFPRARIPAVALELIAGIVVGPAVLGWIEAGPVVSVMASIGIIVTVLGDTGQLDTTVGRFTMSGASAAEVGTIALLGVFFAGNGSSAAVSALLLTVVAVLAVLLLAALRYTLRWAPGRRILDKLDETSAQARVRFAVMILLAAATLAMQFGFEGILGSFVAGVVVGMVVRKDRFEEALRTKLEAIGFGLFVPAFFVASGLRFELSRIRGAAEIERAAIFFVALVAVRTIPALLYRPFLTWRECLAAGLLQSTNLSFIVVAVAVGTELGRIREMNGSALILAGLASAVLLPTAASALLGAAPARAPVGAAAAVEIVPDRL